MEYLEVDYIYYVFPLLCLMLSVNKKFKLFIFIYLIFFLGFSKIGADYLGYLEHFRLHTLNEPLKYIHGEILFKLYMKLFVKLDLSYEVFRIFHLVLFLTLICYFINKISKNYYYSIFILYCGYIIYLCSTYRQLISMSFVIIGIYLFKNKKENMAILLNIFGIGFHSSSILSVVIFFLFKIKRKKLYISKVKIMTLLILSIFLELL